MDMAEKGLVKIMFETVVQEVHKRRLIIEKQGARGPLPNHYLFIFAGAEVPFEFLKSLGIKIDKKFGEPVKKA